MLCLFLIVNLRPGIAGAKVVRLTVFMAHRMVIFNAIREEEFRRFFADLPPWRHRPSRWLAPTEVCELTVCLVQYVSLLFHTHVYGVLMRVAMQTNLVTRISHHSAFFREGLKGMSRYEPRGCDLVLFEKLEKASNTNGTSPVTCEVRSMTIRCEGNDVTRYLG
jgi:hypothetical protein